MPHPVRGGIYPHRGIRRGHFLVISQDALNRAGTTVVVEVAHEAPTSELRALLAVQLTDADPLPESWVLCWRINYVLADRLDVDAGTSQVSTLTMERVVNAVRAAVEP